MICLSCSAELLASYKFCPICGSNQSSSEGNVSRGGAATTSDTSKSTKPSGSYKSTTLGYQKYKELKSEKRAKFFRCDRKGKKANDEDLNEEVTVNVSVMKGQRGKSLPLVIKKSCGKEELMAVAFLKQKAHNKADMKTIEQYELLYPDATIVEKLRESDAPFILHKYKREFGKPYSRITFYLCLKSDLRSYKLTLLKETIISSESDDEGSQCKKLKTELTSLEPSTSNALKPILGLGPPTTACNTEQMETDAALALALQMENVDNTYAALFTVDDQKQELSTTEEVNSDEEIQMFVPNQGDGEDQTIPTAEDVLTELAQQVDISNITKFNVIRTKIFDSAKRALNRKKFNPCHKISVKFTDDVGSSEEAVDLGGPKREFLTLLLHSLLYESPLFFGHPHSRFLSLNQKSLEEEEYRLTGEIIALSLVHGGPAPRCLSNLVFQALVNGAQGVTPTTVDMEDIHDPTKDVILSLNDVKPEEVNQFIEDNERLSTVVDLAGAWKPVKTTEDKISIIQHLIKWFLLGRNQCSIIQFQKGLGVLDKMRQFPDLFKPLMCYSQNTLTVECFEANLSYERSEKGSNAFHLENTALGYWGDFLADTEDRESQLHLKDILMFVTGCFEFPPLGLKITVSFLHGERECRYPKANTCSCVLSLPICHSTYASFKDDMIFTILNTKGFGYA